MSNAVSGTPRRGFLGSIAAGAATLLVGRYATADAEAAALITNQPSDAWVARIKGKYRQVFDVVNTNEGWGPAFGLNFIDSTKQAHSGLTDNDITAVVVVRHFAFPLVLNDAMWAKYKIGEFTKINDPKTNAPATRNVFRDNVPLRPGLTYEQMITNRGVVMVGCNMALTVLSGMLAPKAAVTPDKAKAEWTANLVPGVHLAASGVYAVNRAQAAQCTYCYAG